MWALVKLYMSNYKRVLDLDEKVSSFIILLTSK